MSKAIVFARSTYADTDRVTIKRVRSQKWIKTAYYRHLIISNFLLEVFPSVLFKIIYKKFGKVQIERGFEPQLTHVFISKDVGVKTFRLINQKFKITRSVDLL